MLSFTNPLWMSLDSKIRVALTKHTNGKEADGHKHLCAKIKSKRDELRRATVPCQISGLQLLWLVKRFYEVHDNERITFELSSLMLLEYPGDAKLPEFKEGWDNMVRHLRTPLDKRDLESIYIAKIRGSDTLKQVIDRYDLLTRDDPDHSYEWLSSMTDKKIEDTQRKKNVDSLVVSVSGKKRNTIAPAKDGGGKADGRGGGPGRGKGPGSGKPGDGVANPAGGKGNGCFTCGGDHKAKDCPKGKGKEKKGKAKGKGQGDSSGSESDGSSRKRYKIPKDQLCCIHYLWHKCDKGDDCSFGHRETPTEGIKSHPLYIEMVKKLGQPPAR